MRLLWSEMASLDIEEMWCDVLEASQDIETADNYRNGLKTKVKKKAEWPYSGKKICRLNGEFTGYYGVIFKEYIALYQIEEDAMEVARVMYLKSNYMRRIFGEIIRFDDVED